MRRGREPQSKAMLRPVSRSEQNYAGALHEERAEIAISALCDAAKNGAVSSRHLLRHQAEPRGKVAPFRKGSAIADRSNHCACDDRADAWNRHQPPAALVASCQRFDLIRHAFNALIETGPVADQVFDDPGHTGRQYVGACSQDVRKLPSKEAKSL